MSPVLAQVAEAGGGAAEFWVFLLVGAVSLGSAIAMVAMRNAVHAALMLVVNFFTLAVFYAVLEAQFLAVIQIIVYAGAVMVLFLFVIMLLGLRRDLPIGGRVRGQVPAAIAVAILLVAALGVSVAAPFIGAESVCPPAGAEGEGGLACAGLAAVNAAGNVRAVGEALFTRFVWPFEVTAVLLVVAAIGAMVLGRRHELPGDLVDGVGHAAAPDAGGQAGQTAAGPPRLEGPEGEPPPAEQPEEARR